ncbi:hypothetical protein FA15DRAFT_493935 [Coprinopsis marcescibilis]|uniref:Uncharacterized protein n=1 Tax=Coprinopsis marcescibilis TaxID=230819 RepID=A0A5C3KR54_COPMA|nr:hypothetical protein FA15DRAFT_493935 [Coprinopsis marcescibilis]
MHAIPQRQQRILYLIYASLVISVPIFVLSMLALGSLTLWISPVTTALTVAYDVTALALHFKRRGDPRLPTVARFPSIIIPFLLALAYLAACAVSVVALVFISHKFANSPGNVQYPKQFVSHVRAIAISEIALIAIHGDLLLAIGFLGVQERKAVEASNKVPVSV